MEDSQGETREHPGGGPALWRPILDLPILAKLLMVMLAVCVLPFLVLSAVELGRFGGTRPGGVNVPALFIGLGLILFLLAVGLLSRLIVAPLKELQQWVQSHTGGGFDLQGPEQKDEIGRLARSFVWLVQQRAKAENDMRDQADQIRHLLNATGEGIYSVDPAGCCTLVNASALRMLGYDAAAELIGGNMHELILHTRSDGTPYPAADCKIHHALRADAPITVSGEVFWRKDGTSFPVEYSLHPIEKGGAVTGAVCNFHDITERRKLEEDRQKLLTQLLQAQKMEAVGQLAAGVAHDFNNILTAMSSYGNMALQAVRDQEPASSYVQGVLDAVQRATNVTKSLTAFSRKQLLTPMVFNLNAHLESFGKFLSRLVREDIELRILSYREELPVFADSGQLELVLMNLVANARDAMPAGGRLTIRLELVRLDQQSVENFGFGKPGQFGLISVEDTGIGMDRETREKVFEPFFTTKEVGKGTGLGLSMAYGIIAHHGGFMTVNSEPGKGSAFQVYLPVVRPPSDPPHGAGAAGERRGRKHFFRLEPRQNIRVPVQDS